MRYLIQIATTAGCRFRAEGHDEQQLRVRFDEWPGSWPAAPAGTWRHISTGACWDRSVRNKVGKGHAWDGIQEHGPLVPVSAEDAEWALILVRQAMTR